MRPLLLLSLEALAISLSASGKAAVSVFLLPNSFM
jgi:hypothetical protein